VVSVTSLSAWLWLCCISTFIILFFTEIKHQPLNTASTLCDEREVLGIPS
jgi:hypothetical protein